MFDNELWVVIVLFGSRSEIAIEGVGKQKQVWSKDQ